MKKACDWNGLRWYIIVVGTKKTNNSKGPISESCINIINADPNTNIQIAEISSKFALFSGIPRETIDSNTKGYLMIFGGTAMANVEASKNLPMKRKWLNEKFGIAIQLLQSN